MTRATVLPTALALALTAGAALADIPQQPRSVGGLFFESTRGERPRDGYHLILTGCDNPAPNCRAAKAAEVIGAVLVQVDGKPAPEEPYSLRSAFRQAGASKPLRLTFRRTRMIWLQKKIDTVTVTFRGED